MSEVWRPVVGHEGLYEVSNEGRVRSLDRFSPGNSHYYGGRHLTQIAMGTGHRVVTLSNGGDQKMLVHRLVAQAFIPNPDGLPNVLHWDDDPSNNRAENLRWGTQADNNLDAVRNGTHGNAIKELCPRRHPLQGANLVASNLREGRRNCRACNNARSHARQKGIEFTKELADQFYRKITGRSAA